MKKSVQFQNIKTKQILTNLETKQLKGGSDQAAEAIEIIIDDVEAL